MENHYSKEAERSGELAGMALRAPPKGADHAQLFLDALGASDDQLSWQTFDDAKLDGGLVWTAIALFSAAAQRLRKLAARGAGVFVTPNVVDPKATDAPNKRNVVAARAVFTDNDYGPPPRGYRGVPAPTMVVASAAGPQTYWMLGETADLATAGRIQRHLAITLSADPAAADPARVVRLPGFPHQKNPERPFDVRLIHYDPRATLCAKDLPGQLPSDEDWRSYKDWYAMVGESVPDFIDARDEWEPVRSSAREWRKARTRFRAARKLLAEAGHNIPEELKPQLRWDRDASAATWACRGEWASWRAAASIAGTDAELAPGDERWPSIAPAALRWAASVQAAVKAGRDLPGPFTLEAAKQAQPEPSPNLDKVQRTLLDAVSLFRELGLYLGANDDKHNVTCPWREEHSGPSADSATVVFEAVPFERGAGFKCMHAHCADRGIDDVVDLHADAVMGHLTPVEDAAAVVVEQAINDLPSNAGALLESKVLYAAAATLADDVAAFERLVARLRALKRGTVRLGDWVKAVRRRKKRIVDDRRGARVKRTFNLGDHAELAEALLEEVQGGGEPVVYDVGYIHTYEPESGLWSALPDAELGRRIMSWSGARTGHGDDVKPLRVSKSTVEGTIKLATMLPSDGLGEGYFAAAPSGVMFANGFLRLADDPVDLVFEPSAPAHRQRIALPFEYDETARAPRFTRYLDEIFEGEDDKDAKIRLLQQFVGACLMGLATTYQKVLMLYGEGRNGKSVLIDVVSALFPPGFRAAVPPQDLSNDYKCVLLVGARLNVVNEVPENDILEGSTFKGVVDGSELTKRQIYGRPVRFRPEAGHLFAANDLPGSSDKSLGFWRRWLVVDFNRQFEGVNDEKGLGDKIVASEMPGIAAWAARGAADLLDAGDYVVPQSCIDRVEQWRREADPVRLFLDECAAPLHGPDDWTPAKKLYDAFSTFCSQNGFGRMSSAKFGKRVKRYLDHKKSNGVKYLVRLRLAPTATAGFAAGLADGSEGG